MTPAHTRLVRFLLLTACLLSLATAWCPRELWEDVDGRCHEKDWWSKNRNRPWPWEPNYNSNQHVYRGPGQHGPYDWATMPGYTADNNPGQFFYGSGGSEWIDPFQGRKVVPYINVDWKSAAKIRFAHGVIASAVFILLLPVGAICVAIFPGRAGLAIHIFLQAVAWTGLIIAAGMGIWMAATIKWEFYNLFNSYHVILGLIVLGFITLQPLSGLLGHRGWQRYGYRTGLATIHVWFGRLAILAGMVNGGLGLYIAGNVSGQVRVAYAIIAGFSFFVWFLAALLAALRWYRRDVPMRPRVQGPSVAQRMRYKLRN